MADRPNGCPSQPVWSLDLPATPESTNFSGLRGIEEARPELTPSHRGRASTRRWPVIPGWKMTLQAVHRRAQDGTRKPADAARDRQRDTDGARPGGAGLPHGVRSSWDVPRGTLRRCHCGPMIARGHSDPSRPSPWDVPRGTPPCGPRARLRSVGTAKIDCLDSAAHQKPPGANGPRGVERWNPEGHTGQRDSRPAGICPGDVRCPGHGPAATAASASRRSGCVPCPEHE